MKFLLCFAVLVFSYVESSVLPIEKCSLDDDACLTTQFQNALPTFMSGIPEIGIPVLDVMDMDNLQFDISGLQFSMTDGKLKGLKTSTIDSVKWNAKNKNFRVYFHLNAIVTGHYTAGGRVLILPITGDGDIRLKLKNVAIMFDIDYDVETADDGKDYMALKKLKFEFDVKDNANFYMTNLFNGNKELSEAMLRFLNENWKQISSEFGKPMIEVAAKILFKSVNTYLMNSPMSDIAII